MNPKAGRRSPAAEGNRCFIKQTVNLLICEIFPEIGSGNSGCWANNYGITVDRKWENLIKFSVC
jgi:hypothetical protein